MRYVLLVDFGSTFTKLTAVDLEKELIIATSKALTTVEVNINIGFENALKRLNDQLETPLTFDDMVACSSAAGGLKMAAIGLVEDLTTEAAKRVCLGAGAKVELVLSHHINDDEIQSIIDKKIDIVLLAGGANGGNKECVIFNAKKLAESNVTAPIVFAGNKDATDEIKAILKASGKSFYMCENVMPRLNVLNIQNAKETIKEIFVKNIIEAKGIKKIEKRISKVILPTPNAVLLAAELLSKGFDEEEGLGDLLLCDVGGATTDVYSMADGYPKQANYILSGLEEPFAKRTVEGDLGMRHSALGVYQAFSQPEVAHYKKQGIDLELEAKQRHHYVDFIAIHDHEYFVDDLMASKCIETAVSRHVGTIKGVYTPHGIMYYQVGKDLSKTNYIIGVGGVIISSKKPVDILKKAGQIETKPLELRPKDAKYLLDKKYMLSAMGLLSIDYPEKALRMMKKYLEEIQERTDDASTE